MTELLKTLHQDHKNYAILLNLLEEEADRLEQGLAPDYIKMYDIANYMTSYPDSIHHPHEEFVFDVLKKVDPECAADLDRLNEEHDRLAATGQELKDAVNETLSGAILPKEKILESARAYVDLLRSHMNLEEGKVFRRATARLSDADWRSIDAKLSREEDPLFGAVVQDQFAKLYEGIMRKNGAPENGA